MTSTAEIDLGARVPIDRIIDRVAPLALVGSRATIDVSAVSYDHREVEPGAICGIL